MPFGRRLLGFMPQHPYKQTVHAELSPLAAGPAGGQAPLEVAAPQVRGPPLPGAACGGGGRAAGGHEASGRASRAHNPCHMYFM